MSNSFGRCLFYGLLVLVAVEPATKMLIAGADKRPRTDLHGDSLPEGAIARLGTVRFRHTSQVCGVAYSTDGSLVATVGFDKTVRLWDAATGQEKSRFVIEGMPQGFGAQLLCFAADGKTLAAAYGSTFCIWEVSTGKERLKRTFPPRDNVTGIAFGPGAKTVALLGWQRAKIGAGGEPFLRLWDVAKDTHVAAFAAPPGRTNTVAFSPDGKLLVVGQAEGIHICEPDTGKIVRTLPEKTPSHVVAISADGVLATCGADGKSIQLWDPNKATKKWRLLGHENAVTNLAFSGDGKRIVSAGKDDTVRVWSVAGGGPLYTRRGQQGIGPGCVALSPDGRTVAEGSINSVHALRFWDVATAKETARRGQSSAVEVAGFDSAGKVLTAGRHGPSDVSVWDPADGKLLSVRDEDYVGLIGLSADGKTIAFGRRGGTVCLRDAATGKERLCLEMEAFSVQSLAFAPDGKTLAVGYLKINKGYHCSMIVWDLASGKKLQQFPTPGSSVESAAFTPDGKKLVSTSNGLRIWDPANGNELGQFAAKGFGVGGWGVIRFSPDGELVAGPTFPKYGFGVWKSATREFVGHFGTEGVTVRSVAFSSDCRLLACGKEDGIVELWDVKAWKVVGKGQGPNGRVYALAFSKDDRTLVSGHEDTTALVWDVAKMMLAAPKK